MKKIIGFFGIVLVMSACSGTDTEKQGDEKSPVNTQEMTPEEVVIDETIQKIENISKEIEKSEVEMDEAMKALDGL